MTIKKLYSLISLLSLIFISSVIVAGPKIKVPPLKERVTDLTQTLSSYEISEIENELASFEEEKGSQVVVLMMLTTGDETIEEYSIRVAEEWKIGRKGTDDGVILLIAKNDRKLRIEVGYGLEGIIPDASAARIIDDYITPYFKNGDFAGGINEGLEKIMLLISGENLPEPDYSNLISESVSSPQSGTDTPAQTVGAVLMMLGMIGFFFSFVIISSKAKHFYIAVVVSLVFAIIGGLLMNELVLGSAFGLGITFFILFMRLIFHFAGKYDGGEVGGSYSSGSSSSYSSSSSSSSYSSGSSYSGGGGSFGGGGASGGW